MLEKLAKSFGTGNALLRECSGDAGESSGYAVRTPRLTGSGGGGFGDADPDAGPVYVLGARPERLGINGAQGNDVLHGTNFNSGAVYVFPQ